MMNLRRHNVSEDTQTIRQRNSPLTSDELLLNLPIDLTNKIFSSLPLKSIATCRCVSKRWASQLRRPDFTESFFTKSLTRRKLLFACRKEDKKEVIFFSSPQPQISGENVSLTPTDHHVSFPFECVNDVCSSVNGFLCISDDRILEEGRPELVSVICNPTTRQFFTLPRVETRKGTAMRCFLGYDPVEKQYKVLSVTILDTNSVVEHHQVLTLGTGNNMTWRLVECDIPHSSPGGGCVCINGVLYYTAGASSVDDMIVCFDVRSEKFSFVKAVERGTLCSTLINFQGKLASLRSLKDYVVTGTSRSFEVWVLEDPERHEWSKRIFNVPPLLKDAAPRDILYFVGVTDTNEFVFQPFFSSPFHVYYFNFVKEALTRVEIQGMEAFEEAGRVRMFLNHVEDVKLM